MCDRDFCDKPGTICVPIGGMVIRPQSGELERFTLNVCEECARRDGLKGEKVMDKIPYVFPMIHISIKNPLGGLGRLFGGKFIKTNLSDKDTRAILAAVKLENVPFAELLAVWNSLPQPEQEV